jgi:two-component system chemotaxis response regulator CheY
MAKILIVDDSETLREQLKKDLSEKGHQTIEACDGQDALEVLDTTGGVDLILCDVNMPRMDGLTMCQRLHENEKFAKIPIFMLTTESAPEMKTKGKAVGVIAWVTKPYSAAKLLVAVEKVTAGK